MPYRHNKPLTRVEHSHWSDPTVFSFKVEGMQVLPRQRGQGGSPHHLRFDLYYTDICFCNEKKVDTFVSYFLFISSAIYCSFN